MESQTFATMSDWLLPVRAGIATSAIVLKQSHRSSSDELFKMTAHVSNRSPITPPSGTYALDQAARPEELAAAPATGFPYTEPPAFQTREHRETVHVATVYRYTVRGTFTGVSYTGRLRKCPESERIRAGNCTELSLKKDQQQLTFPEGRE